MAFADGRDNQRLTAAHVAGSEDAEEGGVVGLGAFGGALNVAAPIELDAPNKMGILFCQIEGLSARPIHPDQLSCQCIFHGDCLVNPFCLA